MALVLAISVALFPRKTTSAGQMVRDNVLFRLLVRELRWNILYLH